MVRSQDSRIKLFQFPRPAMFAVPNLSPFCCKLETWLRMAGLDYELAEISNPRKAPKRKLPFIEDGGILISDSARIIEHLTRTKGLDLDSHLTDEQRAVLVVVQRTLEEHYAFIVLYTHFIRPEGWRHTRTVFDAVPALVRPMVVRSARGHMRRLLWSQGVLRLTDEEMIESAISDWRAVLTLMSAGPFFFGDRPSSLDAVVFGALATTVLTDIQSPIRAFLQTQPQAMAYAHDMRSRFFPELGSAGPD